MNHSWPCSIVAAPAALALAGCGGVLAEEPRQREAAPLTVPATSRAGTFTARWPVLEGFVIDPVRSRSARSPIVTVSASLSRCTEAAPRFDFDEAAVDDDDGADLARLAGCLTRGALRDRNVEIIGHADASGGAYYNEDLGRRRAAHVKRILVDLGVSPARIVIKTRGARDAVGGMSGYTAADDRRVDLRLMD